MDNSQKSRHEKEDEVMGISAFILFDKGSEVPIEEFSSKIELECVKKNVDFELHLENNNGKIGSHNYAVISNKGKMKFENLNIYIKNKDLGEDYMILDWYSKTHIFFFSLSLFINKIHQIIIRHQKISIIFCCPLPRRHSPI